LSNRASHIGLQAVWLLLSAAVAVLLISAGKTRDLKHCTAMSIRVENGNEKVFVDEKEIRQLVQDQVHADAVGYPVSGFNLFRIEKALKEMPWISCAELYFDNRQVLHISVMERIPVARIMDAGANSYYIDSACYKLPLSKTDRADVPVFTGLPTRTKANGNLYDSLIKQVVYISSQIVPDEFWMAQAAQVNMIRPGYFEIIPAIGNHIIELGTANKVDEKLHNLKLFYKQVLVRKGFDSYKALNASYAGQIVAVRNDTATGSINTQKALELYESIIQANKDMADETAIHSEPAKGRIVSVSSGQEVKAVALPPPDKVNTPKAPPAADTASPAQQPKAIMPKQN
jgi:cell division protein FtsQ